MMCLKNHCGCRAFGLPFVFKRAVWQPLRHGFLRHRYLLHDYRIRRYGAALEEARFGKALQNLFIPANAPALPPYWHGILCAADLV